MKQTKASNNVIQFPSRSKREETPARGANPPPPPPTNEPKPTKRVPKKNIAGAIVAIVIATGAVNKYALDRSSASVASTSLSSNAQTRRGLASVERRSFERNADWEKHLAEELAQGSPRDVASIQFGRPATMEEKLRWGTLEEKYTIRFRPDVHAIDSISLQDLGNTDPAYVLSRDKFLRDYGQLMTQDFDSAKLKSVQTVNDRTIELYTLFDKAQNAKGEARFELDRHKRLLSLKVEPTQI